MLVGYVNNEINTIDFASTYIYIFMNIQGAVFMELWKRQNSKLAHDWHVHNYENFENDLPNYIRKKEQDEKFNKRDGLLGRIFLRYRRFIKYAISLMIIMLMVNMRSCSFILII